MIERAPSAAPVSKRSLSEERPVVVEALCYHEALLRLGYEPDEIFVSLNKGDLFVVLDVAGRRFFITVGPLTLDNDTFKNTWRVACDTWNKSEQGVRQATFERSYAYRNAFDFSAALLAKGFDRHLKKAQSAN
jgi:hypothetical protein